MSAATPRMTNSSWNFSRHPVLLALASLAMAGACVSGCAATPQPYNPDNLGAADFAQVSGICQNVMGLSPHERLSGGYWLGNDRLDYWTSYYRGCIVSLSDTLQRIVDTRTSVQADEDCRAKGLRSGSSELALCVLQTANSRPAETYTSAQATPVSQLLPPAGSYFRASAHETARREQLSCAALGLEPTQTEFNRCVKNLSGTFYALDNPIN